MSPTQCCRAVAMLMALAAFAAPSLAETYAAKVVGIADGDTVTVLDAFKVQHKIRLSGIDAPERSQPYGQVSRQHLARLVFGKTVTIETAKTDRYGRELGKVLVGHVDANLEQLRSGYAWHYRQYAHEQPVADREPYAQAEVDAREARRGLWRDTQPTPPWEFRRTRRNQTDRAEFGIRERLRAFGLQ